MSPIKEVISNYFYGTKISGRFFKKTDDSQGFPNWEHELYQELTEVQKQNNRH